MAERGEPVRVTREQLREIWFRPDAIGLLVDASAGVKVVTLLDGTTYAAPLEVHRG